MSCNNLALSVDRERDRCDTGVAATSTDSPRFMTVETRRAHVWAGHIANKPSMSDVGRSAGPVIEFEIETDLRRLNVGGPFPPVGHGEHKWGNDRQ